MRCLCLVVKRSNPLSTFCYLSAQRDALGQLVDGQLTVEVTFLGRAVAFWLARRSPPSHRWGRSPRSRSAPLGRSGLAVESVEWLDYERREQCKLAECWRNDVFIDLCLLKMRNSESSRFCTSRAWIFDNHCSWPFAKFSLMLLRNPNLAHPIIRQAFALSKLFFRNHVLQQFKKWFLHKICRDLSNVAGALKIETQCIQRDVIYFKMNLISLDAAD